MSTKVVALDLQIVQSNFEMFRGQLMEVTKKMTDNPLTVSLSPFQSSFCQVVAQIMLTPSLWQRNDLLHVVTQQSEAVVYYNITFPQKENDDILELRKFFLYINYDPNTTAFFEKQAPELTYMCNLCSLLTAWQQAYHMRLFYRNVTDKTSFVYRALPFTNTLQSDNLSFFLHLACQMSAYKLLTLLLVARNKNDTVRIAKAKDLFESQEMRTAISQKKWNIVKRLIDTQHSTLFRSLD